MPVKRSREIFFGTYSGLRYRGVMATVRQFQKGDFVRVRDAFGELLLRRALGDVVMGHDFSVVWLARHDEWEAAEAEGREPEGVPWPAEDVEPADEPDENETAYRVVEEATGD
jgi:hypothetical protein